MLFHSQFKAYGRNLQTFFTQFIGPVAIKKKEDEERLV